MTSRCLSEDDVALFVGGGMRASAHERTTAHIDHCQLCADVVGVVARTVVTGPTSAVAPTSLAAPEKLARGQELGRYLVLQHIGSGGLGDVYEAFDPELDRRIALKLLRTTRRDPALEENVRARLLREAQALAKIRHASVVTVFDVGVDHGQIYIAMELIDGVTFKEWLAQSKRSWRAIRDALVAAGRGLAAAHAVGLIHRDFKPANVLVGADDHVTVIDFGLARALENGGDGAEPGQPALSVARPSVALLGSPLTQTGMVLGTPAYMAPEQSTPHNAGPEADQFAFCVTAFEALYGRLPFEGTTVHEYRNSVNAGALVQHDTSRGPAFMRRAVARGLTRDPARRHASMEALLDELTADQRSRRRQRATLAALVLGVAAATWVGARQLNPVVEQDDAIDALVQQAHQAAAKGLFVYPSPDHQEASTAYLRVRELEALQGFGDQGARQASDLREEFADTLVRLGDRYWSSDAARPFALDYYAQALVFVPQRAHALQRASTTLGERVALREKAEGPSFTQAELVAAEPLVALAATAQGERSQKLEQLLSAPRTRSVTARARLERLAPPPRTPRPTKPAPSPPPADPTSSDIAAAATVAAMRPEPSAPPARETPRPVDPQSPTPTKKGALVKALAEAKAAARAGRRDAAAKAFHRALAADRRSVVALVGLSDLAKQQGRHAQAARMAEQAVEIQPANARLRIRLGDAYYKTLSYSAAVAQYERALALKHPNAQERLDRVSRKLGHTP